MCTVTSSSGASTSVRSKSMCGETGVTSRARWRGDTIGPRADREYAVEPVGVAMMSPSAAYVVNGTPAMSSRSRTVWPDDAFSITTSFSASWITLRPSGRRHRGRHHHPFLDVETTAEVALERLVEMLGLEFGEVAEHAAVDAEHRDAEAADESDGAQHGAVAADAQRQFDALGVVDRAGQPVESDGARVVGRHEYTVPRCSSHSTARRATRAASGRS